MRARRKIVYVTLVGMLVGGWTFSFPASDHVVHAEVDEQRFARFIERISQCTWRGKSIELKYLGALDYRTTLLGKLECPVQGLAIDSKGRIAVNVGSGTTPNNELFYWHPRDGKETIIPIGYHHYENPKRHTPADEEKGVFWFFGGPVAFDHDDRFFFNISSCCDSGVLEVVSRDPVRVKRRNYVSFDQSMQIPTFDPDYAYSGWCQEIARYRYLDEEPEQEVIFTLDGEEIFISGLLFLDPDRLFLGLTFKHLDAEDEYSSFGLLFDRERKGYYLFKDSYLRAMAISPDSSLLLDHGWFDHEVRKIEILTAL